MINCSIDESFGAPFRPYSIVPALVIFQYLRKNLLKVRCTWVSGTPSAEGHRGDVIHVKVYGNLKDLHLYQHCSNDREGVESLHRNRHDISATGQVSVSTHIIV